MNELNIESFDFTNGFKCSDVHRYNKLNNLSVKIYELDFYQDGDKYGSDKDKGLLVYKNHYELNKK